MGVLVLGAGGCRIGDVEAGFDHPELSMVLAESR
jgi:hypothetical protein